MLDKILNDLNKQSWVKILLKLSDVYIVGGCVRDAYLNKPIKDIDLVVDGLTTKQIQDLLVDYGKINIVGESFVVIKFKPFGHTGEDYDIAVPRKDRKTGTGHKGFDIETGVGIKNDLERRDFTINSIAIDIKTGETLDLHNGLEDLKNNILRLQILTHLSMIL
jgi:tRNA nucleotidyltransferase (CCA-adding enzyme)